MAVALVGFMGAGKTTVGRQLAQTIGWRFLDVDELIEQREHKTIEQIFREHGEPAFRRMECAAVRDAINSQDGPIVLALGGGAFIEPGIQKCLLEARVPTAFLDAPVMELFRRCEQPEKGRPLKRDPNQFRELYERRRPQYVKATILIDTHAKSIPAVTDEIISGLKLIPNPGVRD